MTQRAKAHFAATLGKLDDLAFRQREGLLSTLPLALNAVAEWRSLDTSSIARLFPFSPPDLDTRSGTLYGIDMRACSPVVYDLWDGTHLNANTAVLARSGSGKSFATKLGMLRGLTRGVTAYVIDPEGEYADMARAAGGRVLSPGVPGQGMNPFVIDKGDSEEMLQRIGSLRRASLDHALAGYYARPRERTGFRDFYKYLQEDEAGDRDPESSSGQALARLLRPFATGSLRHLLSDEGDDLLSGEALITVFDLHLLEPELRPAAAMVCTETVWAAAAQDPKPRLLVVDEVWSIMQHPEGAAFMVSMAKRAQAPAGVAVHHPGRPGPPLRGLLPHHHRTLRSRPPPERRLQAALAAGRRRHQHRGRRLRPAQRPSTLAAVVPQGRRLASRKGQPFPRPHRGHPGGDGGHRVEAGPAWATPLAAACRERDDGYVESVR